MGRRIGSKYRSWLPQAACLVLLAASAVPANAQHIKDGAWVGIIIHLTGRGMEAEYQVSNADGKLAISMRVDNYGPFEFKNLRTTPDSLKFTWEPSFELACSLARLDDDIYQGACMDPWGGFGGIVFAPPGTDVSSIELHNETIESIAGWTPPPPPDSLPPLGDDYPLGTRIEVQGRTMNYVVAGEGAVTVVLEAGLGDNLSTWEQVQRLLSRDVRVFAYDRAGIGYSEVSDGARTPEQVAVELRGLLREAGIAPPYVLVAHAEGALFARRFSSLYKDAVQGMVLVDPHFETQIATWRALDADSWDLYWSRRKAFSGSMPGAWREEFGAYAAVLEAGSLHGSADEPNVPLTVFTAGEVSESPRWIGEEQVGREAWAQLHADWTEAAGGRHIVVETSGPALHQEYPVRVYQAILELLQ